MKIEQRNNAIKLRQNGQSINSIAKELNVSKSSVSIWVKDIILTDKQKEKFINDKKPFLKILSSEYVTKCRLERLKYQNEGRLKAKEKEIEHAIMCMLYWGEGEKSRNVVCMSNSDIFLLKLFLNYIRKYFKVINKDISIYINTHTGNGLSKEEIEKYWLDGLNLTKESLRKTTFNNYSIYSKKKKVGKLLYGTCRVVICKTSIVQHIYGAIQEYGNFYNNNWLNKK